ncbi:MAG TPA: sigma-54-dependent Fis family transcriptional regulator [Candidatus Marinimicrobia bacterium]|nr:sigma-54-dependent Fis family transcriptional regulator [Candidatus Neomarinimicrobiota bacterium]
MSEERIINVLLIEDEVFDVQRVKNTVKQAPYIHILHVVPNGNESLDILKKCPIDVVIMDFQIAGGLQGESLIQAIKTINSQLQIIVITKMTINQTDFKFANSLIEAGAYWFCTKYPGDIEDYIYQPTDFVLSIKNAWEKKKLEEARSLSENRLNKNIQAVLKDKKIIGESLVIQKMIQRIHKFAATQASVLITGASGTGKELVATHIHYKSPRKYEPFVTVNCGGIPSELLESELFGFEKGSFTGAGHSREGLFEQADGGTIFLDEIGELPLNAQSKLLRVLQEGEIDKIGRRKQYKVDVRVIAASNKKLAEQVKKKAFREDLFYRLNVLQIEVPPLAERLDDIPLLVSHFLNIFAGDFLENLPVLTEESIQILKSFHWPGNVRQLQNVVQRILFSYEDEITPETVRIAIGVPEKENHIASFREQFNPANIQMLRDIESHFRREYIQFVRSHSDTDAEAARKLGIAPPNFHRMCKELGIKG